MEGDLENMEQILVTEITPKKAIKWTIIIPIIVLVVIVAVVIIIIFATSGDKDNCIIGKKEKCATCDGDKYRSCNY